MKKLILIFLVLISFQSFSQRLIDLPTATTYLGGDYLVLEPLSSSGNTSKIAISDFFTDVTIIDSLNVSGESILSDTVRITKPMYIAGNLFNGTGIGSAAAGSTGNIQFNTSNVFDFDPYLYWHKANNYLRVKNLHVQDTLKIIDNSQADTTLIFDDGDTLRFISDNPVKMDLSVTGNNTELLLNNSGQIGTDSDLKYSGDTLYIKKNIEGDTIAFKDTIVEIRSDTTFIRNKLKVTDGAIYVDGRTITPSTASAYIADGDELNTTISVADTYYFLKGTFTNKDTYNFQFDGDTLKYIGNETINVLILYSCTFGVGQVSTIVTTGISINDVVLPQSEMTRTISATSEFGSWSGLATTELSTNDKIKLLVKANKTGTVIAYKFPTVIKN